MVFPQIKILKTIHKAGIVSWGLVNVYTGSLSRNCFCENDRLRKKKMHTNLRKCWIVTANGKIFSAWYFFMGHDDGKTGLEKLKDHDWTNKLMKVSMGGPSINWKLLDLLVDYWKDRNPSASELLPLDSCGIHILHGAYPAGNYMFKVNNRNTRARCEICSKLIIKTPERRQFRGSEFFIVNFEHVSHLLLVFLLLTLSRVQ